MIQIKLNAYSIKSSNRFKVEGTLVNQIMEDLKQRLSPKIGNLSCEKHPNEDGLLSISYKKGNIVTDLNACCDSFKREIIPKVQGILSSK